MHFYEQTETGVLARHFVPMASRPEELRPTRISDVRKWTKEGRVVVPSVTTVLNVLAKPALQNWYVEQHLKQAAKYIEAMREFPPGWIFRPDEFVSETKRLTEIELDKAPTAGSDIHKSLEAYVNQQLPESHDDVPLCDAVFGIIASKTGSDETSWTSEPRFVSDGFGGQVDLCNDFWIIDFKSKQTAEKFEPGKMVYNEHIMQLAAYREGLGLPKARAANVFVCLEDGQIDFHEHSETELQRGWKMFEAVLTIWNLQNRAA